MLGRRQKWPQIPHEELIRRARILVIDDQEFPYQKLFERDGYTVDKWNDVDELSNLETGKYDLILLDLLGVGRRETADQGLGVLKHIRTVRPAQLVIAYSSADWPLQYQPFFDLADAVLSKTADYLDFKRTVDDLLERRFSLGFYLERIETEARAYPEMLPKLRSKAGNSILHRDIRRLRRYLERNIDDAVTIDRILQVAEIAIGVLNVWKN